MELELGMYVRTKKGKIYKFESNNSMAKNGAKKYMVNCSYNIIDLIEVGDYVNDYKVSFKGNDYRPFVQCDYPVEEGTINHYRFYEETIYSIVTKEQFESMSYKVGE